MTDRHDDIAELLGAYALDAVDPDEARLVEDHLRTCPRCAAEVAEHREVAAMLAHSGAPAPEGVWARISESLEEPPPELTLPLTGRAAPVASLDDRRRSNRAPLRWLPAAAAAAAVLVVAGVVAGFALDEGPSRSEPVASSSLQDLAREVLNDPDARKVVLSPPDGGEVAAAAAVDVDGSGYLVGSTLPSLDPSRTYQLWGISDRVVVSLGVLGASPGVVAFHVDEGIHTLAITEEEAGGVPSSANPPALVGELS
ncbi:MAG: anti-sigma factor domain-containing protein [Acidimicrobiia bacterium]